MKTTLFILSLLLLLAPFEAARAEVVEVSDVVVLSADQVHTAIDIENALKAATADGTRPGQVVLDGSRGIFQYDSAYGNDFDINIFYSDVVLRGDNRAVIQGGGINLDGMTLENITIQNLGMVCPADCISSPSGIHLGVNIIENWLIANNIGIQVMKTDEWVIQQNTIQAGSMGIQLVETSGITVKNNRIAGEFPILLQEADHSVIQGNTLLGSWQGVRLLTPSNNNQVISNMILGVQAAGISLEPGTYENHIHSNLVKCARGYACLTVDAPGSAAEENYIWGNRP